METQTNGKMIIMKRYIIYLLSIIVLISCSKEQDAITDNGVNYSPKFYAEIDNTLTRAYVNDALKVCWSENDKLSVFTSTENQLYQFDGNTGDSEGTFSKVESYSSSTGASLSVDANYAVYPYSEQTTISSDGTLTFVLPQNQVYVKNSFGVNSNPMIAVTENRNDTYLSFKNICGYLRVSLYGDSITAKSIRLEGNSNERISGKANVSISYGQKPIITLADDALHTITLDCQDGVQIGESASDATEIWFVLPPVTFENGFTLIIEDISGNKYIKSTEKKIEVKRNTISNMAISKVEQLMEYCYNFLEEDLCGWESGVHYYDDKNSFYIVSQTDTTENREIFVMNKFSSEHIDDAIILCFDSNQIQDVFINGYQFKAHTIDNNIIFLVYDSQGVNIDSFEIPYENSETLYYISRAGIEHYRIVSLRNFLAKAGKLLYDVTGVSMNLCEGKYAEILEDFIIGKFAENVSKKVFPQILIAETIKQHIKTLYEREKNWFLGNSSIEISSIKRISPSAISVQGYIANISSIPKSRLVVYNGVQGYTDNIILYGVAEAKSGQPGLYINDNCYNLKMVSETEFVCTLNVDFEPGQTYYFRPFLVPEVKIPNTNEILPNVATCIRYGNRKSYTDLMPNCTTGECIETTENSAVVECSYTNVYGLECGVYVSNDDETKKFTTNSIDGVREINLSGLRPATTYNYWAFINVNGEYINGQVKSFTTDLPDVTGTWTCKEKHGENYTSYTVTLHKDGTVTTSSSSLENYKYKSWSQSATGLSVRFIWSTGDMGHDLRITFDDPTNPTSGKGNVHEWTVSSWGISHDTWYDLEMTR